MKRKAAKSDRKPSDRKPSDRKPSRRPQPKSSRAPSGRYAGAEAAKASRPPSRAVVMRLAAEVDALAVQLQDSRARILDLEARVDVDPLTDVLNRRGFERELKRSLAYVKRYGTSAALIYIDLDGFKPVNDRHGHGAGDAVLKAIAAALSRNVRASDVVARIGGDEFAVLLWNVNGANAAAKAGALEAAVYGTPVRWSSSTLVVGASAGVALLGALDSPADVIARADAAMYARKDERKAISSLSPRAGREGWGEGAPPLGSERFQKAQTRGNAPFIPAFSPHAGRRRRSRNNIRRELVFDEGDAVAQLQLALLQALYLDDVGAGRILQRRNRGVEVAMLLLQARQLRPKLAFFLLRHRRLGRAVGAVKIAFGAV